MFESILSLYTIVTSCKKSENFNTLIFDDTWKTSFYAHFRSPLAQKPQNKILPTVTLCKNQKYFECQFSQNLKNLISVYFSSFWPEKP